MKGFVGQRKDFVFYFDYFFKLRIDLREDGVGIRYQLGGFCYVLEDGGLNQVGIVKMKKSRWI